MNSHSLIGEFVAVVRKELNGVKSKPHFFWTGTLEYWSLGTVPQYKLDLWFLHFTKVRFYGVWSVDRRFVWYQPRPHRSLHCLALVPACLCQRLLLCLYTAGSDLASVTASCST